MNAELRGSAAIPAAEGSIEPTTIAAIDEALSELAAQKNSWVSTSVSDRRALLAELKSSLMAVADDWVQAAQKAKRIPQGSSTVGEEWLGGPFTVMRNLRLLDEALKDIETHGRPQPPGPVHTLPNGFTAVKVFPNGVWDHLFYQGFHGELWLKPGTSPADAIANQAKVYQQKAAGNPVAGKMALVLSAGNVASIGPMDALHKLFIDDQVVVLKANPVNEYLGPFIEKAFSVLIERGFLKMVYGGVEQGAYLCQHPEVEEIHITGSDKTHDAIVYGVGEEGRKNKEARQPINTREISSELGNVSPVIVVPGPWSAGDIRFQAENVASMIANNGGFNCNAIRVLINHGAWAQRDEFLDAIRSVLSEVQPRQAYYPGASERFERFVSAHPDAERIGNPGDGALPWTLIAGLDSETTDDICFNTEAFCSVFSETRLEAASVAEYIDRAVDFANQKVWGSLNVSILVHPKTLKDPMVSEALERALTNLRFGSVVVNHWPALSYGCVTTCWGAYPGHELHDIQSGRGFVHNTFMFEDVEKTVIRGPFRVFPKPPWFVTHQNTPPLARKLLAFEANPGPLKLPAIFATALKG